VISRIKAFIKTDGQLWSDEYRFQHCDGSYVYIFDRGYLIRDEAGVPVRMIGAMADVTERHNLSEQLRQAQKMEAIGQLAGGVAHDMNNMLMVISSYITLIEEKLNPSETASRYLREVHKAANKGASFTSQLLAFSRKQVLMPQVVNLNDFISEQISILQRLIGEDIELTFEPCSGSPSIKFDSGQLAQVLMNLAANARDAMPMGGTLRVQTREVELGADRLPVAVNKPGAYVCLTVTDTGIGMTEQVRARIFEPFFTTKGRANGTGLGLATVYGIVQQSESSIDVVSAPGKGTTFNIYIPACEAAVQKRQEEIDSADLSGDETILLVEDESGIRVAAAEYLEGLGYKVLTAQDGMEAMRIARERTSIDLLISDVIMPRMSGQELVSRFRALYPHASVLLISGYTDDLLKNHAVVAAGMGFLQKPFSLKHLAERVRALLAQQPDREAGNHASAEIPYTSAVQ
jgi:signal transduction histidine kinase/ActR/RegA family two-component response regulator